MFDFDGQLVGARRLEQVQRRVQGAVGRPAYQALVGDDGAAAHVDDGLEQRLELAARDDVLQMSAQLQLLGGGRRRQVTDAGGLWRARGRGGVKWRDGQWVHGMVASLVVSDMLYGHCDRLMT